MRFQPGHPNPPRHQAKPGRGDQPDNLITLCMYCHAVIHGTRFPDMPDWMDQAELNQAAVEYVADHYAGSWWPWAKNYMEMREGG